MVSCGFEVMQLKDMNDSEAELSKIAAKLIQIHPDVVHIFLPAISDILIVAITVAILVSGLLEFLIPLLGGITSVLLLSGTLALVWLIIHTRMILNLQRS